MFKLSQKQTNLFFTLSTLVLEVSAIPASHAAIANGNLLNLDFTFNLNNRLLCASAVPVGDFREIRGSVNNSVLFDNNWVIEPGFGLDWSPTVLEPVFPDNCNPTFFGDSINPEQPYDVNLKAITSAFAPPPNQSFSLANIQGVIEFINYSQEPLTVNVNWRASGLVQAFGPVFAQASVDFSTRATVCLADPIFVFPDCDPNYLFDQTLDLISVVNDNQTLFLSPNERRGTIPPLPISPAIYVTDPVFGATIYPSITQLYVEATSESRAIASTVPEPSSTLSLLALGTLGTVSALKRKQKHKSTEKETIKVG